jgi:hypothetical protein
MSGRAEESQSCTSPVITDIALAITAASTKVLTKCDKDQ